MRLFDSRSMCRVRWALSLAASIAFAGCTQEAAPTRSKPSSVQTSDVTRIAPRMQSNVMNFPTGSGESSVLRVEQITPREVRAGVEYGYEVKVTNLTDASLQGVTLRASKPEGVRVTGTTPSATTQPSADGWLSYDVGTLGPHESRSFPMTVTPTGEGVIRQSYDVKYEQRMATSVNVTSPSVAVTKRGPAQADVCEEIVWNYEVRNAGSGIARNVTLRDQLPEGLATADGARLVQVDLGDIPGGESRQATARLKAARSGKFTSAATVSSDAGNANSASVTTVARQPVLEVGIKGPDKEYLGKPVVYQVTIANKGDAAAQTAALKIATSANANVMAVADSNGTALAAEGGSQSLGIIDPGQSKTVNVTLMSTQGGPLKVDATASARCAAQVAKAGETEIMTVAALLLEAVDTQDPVRVGENVVYKIKVTNQGNGADSDVQVTAVLPEGQEFVAATGVTEGTRNAQTVVFGPVQMLAPKQSATWEITAKATKAADVQFKVTATSTAVKVPAEKTETTKLY